MENETLSGRFQIAPVCPVWKRNAFLLLSEDLGNELLKDSVLDFLGHLDIWDIIICGHTSSY
jgi:hypothetical protein